MPSYLIGDSVALDEVAGVSPGEVELVAACLAED